MTPLDTQLTAIMRHETVLCYGKNQPHALKQDNGHTEVFFAEDPQDMDYMRETHYPKQLDICVSFGGLEQTDIQCLEIVLQSMRQVSKVFFFCIDYMPSDDSAIVMPDIWWRDHIYRHAICFHSQNGQYSGLWL